MAPYKDTQKDELVRPPTAAAANFTPPRDPRIMAIRTGLSKTVAGHLIELDRDQEAKIARVIVRPLKDDLPQPTEVELAAIKVAADLLAQQAKRFLGLTWTVKQWVRY